MCGERELKGISIFLHNEEMMRISYFRNIREFFARVNQSLVLRAFEF